MIKVCEYGCGLEANFKLKNGKHCCHEYHASCPAIKNKCKIGQKKSWTDERKKEASKKTKRQWNETDTLSCESVTKKRNHSLKKVWSDQERRDLNSQKNKDYWNQFHIKNERRKQSKKLFKNPDYVKKWKKGLTGHPNKCETRIYEILEELLPGQYKFTGAFTFWIDMLNPDFVCKDKRKIIEFFGDYWHKKEDVENRNKIFNKYGYECLYIWECELKDLEQIRNKIIKFHERKSI
jgi:very-short-patch-repair endonuclease